MMAQHPQIHDDASYQAALNKLVAAMGSAQAATADEMQSLASLIGTYERRRWPFGSVDPISFLMNVMALTGRTQVDLGILVGSRERAIEILSRKRHLSMTQIHHIAQEWNIPAKMLMGS